MNILQVHNCCVNVTLPVFAFISGGRGRSGQQHAVFEASLCWLGRLTALQLWHWLSSTERERETADFIALHSVVDVIHVLVFLNETLAELS